MSTIEELAGPGGLGTVPLGHKQIWSLADAATGRVCIWEGSVRSGKTFITLFAFICAIATYSGPGSFLIVGKNRDTIYRNIFEPIERDPYLAFLRPHIKYRRGGSQATIVGESVNIVGANDVGAESKIRGFTAAKILGDEITTWPEDFFKQLLARMSPVGAQMFATTNPDSPAHWLKVGYLDRLATLPGWKSYHFTMDDNPGLGADYVASLKAEYVGVWYLRYIEGLWVAAEGAIYPMWDSRRHIVAWTSLPPMWRLYAAGIDYGTTNATSVILIGLGIDRRLYLIDEWRWDSIRRQEVLTDHVMTQRIYEWLREGRLPQEGPSWPQYFAVDPAAASLKAELRQHPGLQHVHTANADNDVAYGIRTVATLLQKGLLLVSDRCTGFIQEIPGYSWDPKATEKGEDKPIKTADHSMDAGRYAITTTEDLWRDDLLAPASDFTF